MGYRSAGGIHDQCKQSIVSGNRKDIDQPLLAEHFASARIRGVADAAIVQRFHNQIVGSIFVIGQSAGTAAFSNSIGNGWCNCSDDCVQLTI